MGGSFVVCKLKPWHAEAFIAERLSAVPSVATVNKDIRTLRGIFNRAIEPRPQRLTRIRAKIAARRWRPGAEVINNLSRDFDVICRRANVADCTRHDLRRSAITNWARRLPSQVVQTLAEHASITTTRKYYLAVRSEDLRLAGRLVDELTAGGGEQTDTILTPPLIFDPKTDPWG